MILFLPVTQQKRVPSYRTIFGKKVQRKSPMHATAGRSARVLVYGILYAAFYLSASCELSSREPSFFRERRPA